ncbi:stage III sporulation protein AG [Paenibacillus sp. J31TS4]|uniref:stage III sporulation protein AG n=1 Tax=Paenibacillus sp. J31TS4 TaxID=2807195 RepID=UPI001B113E0F|nr:stage III sporulation protein AG [Paenibacillus sp. J31TS4]GIP37611.1 stage III sporulation protein AG [Paenibacillus sp. J31TS4]
MANWLKVLESRLGGGEGGPKRIRTFRWLLLVGLLGAALMILNSFLTVKDVDPIGTGRASPPGGSQPAASQSAAGKEQTGFRQYEEAYENQLRDILQKIVGVGEVEVMVTVDSTEEVTVEKNTTENQQTITERDQNGGNRVSSNVSRSGTVASGQGSGGEGPLILKTTKPKIRGVVVVARGAENATVKKLIAEAVERGLDVPVTKISVVPRKQ